MLAYKDIPSCIRESVDIQTLRRHTPHWGTRKLLREYMQSFVYGGLHCQEVPVMLPGAPPDRHLLALASYYVIRREFLKRMSPLVSKRSREMLELDNHQLLDQLDRSLADRARGFAANVARYVSEICRRATPDFTEPVWRN